MNSLKTSSGRRFGWKVFTYRYVLNVRHGGRLGDGRDSVVEPEQDELCGVNIHLKFFWTCRNTISIVVKFLTQKKKKIVVKFPC
jgi:hypothetical protein